MKAQIIVLVYLLSWCSLFGFSRKNEVFVIVNNTACLYKLHYSYKDDKKDRYLFNNVEGINIAVRKSFVLQIAPHSEEIITRYYPQYGIDDFQEYFEKLANISFDEKMRTLFNHFNILGENNELLFCLDDIGKNVVGETWDDGNYYLFVISECNTADSKHDKEGKKGKGK